MIVSLVLCNTSLQRDVYILLTNVIFCLHRGGPTRIHVDFDNSSKRSNWKGDEEWNKASGGVLPGSMHKELKDLLINPEFKSIGKRLLHKIGYSESSLNKSISGGGVPFLKLDKYGIGYNPFKNAPEFAKEFENRKRRAALNNQNSCLGMAEICNADFIGTKTSDGFALHDDDDDNVYDSSSNKPRIDYSSFVVEEYDSNEDEKKSEVFRSTNTLMENDNCFIAGFCSGTSMGSNIKLKRWPGPKPPIEFREGRPSCLQSLLTISSPVDNEQQSSKEQQSRNHELKKTTMVRPHFANIASLMQNRFTSSSSTSTPQTSNNFKVGLTFQHPKKVEKLTKSYDVLVNQSRKKQIPPTIKVTRQFISWIPSLLLCKRFHVKESPNSVLQTFQTAQSDPIMNKNLSSFKESEQFHTQILSQLPKSPQPPPSTQPQSNNNIEIATNTACTTSTAPSNIVNSQRPSIDLFKSIFEVTSSEEEEKEIEDNNDNHSDQQPSNNNTKLVCSTAAIQNFKAQMNDEDSSKSSSKFSKKYSKKKKDYKRKKRKYLHHKSHKRKKRHR